MKLSDAEKLILVMLTEVYKALKIKGEIDPNFVQRAIFNDQLWSLRWQYSGLFNSPEDSPPVVKETCDILDMYRLISSSYEKLSRADKERVKKEAYPFSDFIKYQGFDGNNDPHLSVVSTLVKDLDRYTEIKNPDLNSHSSGTITTYRRMLERYEPLTNPYPREGLTADQLIHILKG